MGGRDGCRARHQTAALTHGTRCQGHDRCPDLPPKLARLESQSSGRNGSEVKRNRFTTEQIVGILKEQDAAAKAGDLARKHGVSEHTIYRWKGKYGGPDVNDA